MSTFIASTLALLTVVVVVEGVALLSLMRQVGTVLSHVAPPRPGSLEGGPQRGDQIPDRLFAALNGSQGGVLVFLSTNCPTCKPIEKTLRIVAAHYPELSVVPVVLGDVVEQREEYARALAVPGLADFQELAVEWSIPGTPYAVGVDANGHVVGTGIVNTLDHLEALADVVASGSLGEQQDSLERIDPEAAAGFLKASSQP